MSTNIYFSIFFTFNLIYYIKHKLIYRRSTILYAIGDIHGKLDPLLKLRSKILHLAPTDEENTVIFLGDYIDRGGEDKEVLELLLNDPFPGFNVIFLKGNHEQMFQFAKNSYYDYEMWYHNGGQQTEESIGFSRIDINSGSKRLEPLSTFMTKLNKKPFHIVGKYLFAHSGYDISKPLCENTEDDFLWSREHFLNYKQPYENGYIVIHGHTPCKIEDCLQSNRICVDTNAYWSGTLTAAIVNNAGDKFIGLLHS